MESKIKQKHKHNNINTSYKHKKKWKDTNPEQIFWQVSSFINASVHGDETLYGGLVLYVWVVKAGV